MGNLFGDIMVDYWDFTVVQLKDILRQRGLKVSGRKYQLIARLRAEEEPILYSGEYVDITEYVALSRADNKDFLKPYVRNIKHKQTKEWLPKFKNPVLPQEKNFILTVGSKKSIKDKALSEIKSESLKKMFDKL